MSLMLFFFMMEKVKGEILDLYGFVKSMFFF